MIAHRIRASMNRIFDRDIKNADRSTTDSGRQNARKCA